MTAKHAAHGCMIGLAITLASAVPVVCQTSSPTSQPCAQGKSNSGGQTLSGKLSRSNGVLCPPNVDPGMTAPAPNKGTMPVIPPPGSSPNQNVQPK